MHRQARRATPGPTCTRPMSPPGMRSKRRLSLTGRKSSASRPSASTMTSSSWADARSSRRKSSRSCATPTTWTYRCATSSRRRPSQGWLRSSAGQTAVGGLPAKRPPGSDPCRPARLTPTGSASPAALVRAAAALVPGPAGPGQPLYNNFAAPADAHRRQHGTRHRRRACKLRSQKSYAATRSCAPCSANVTAHPSSASCRRCPSALP